RIPSRRNKTSAFTITRIKLKTNYYLRHRMLNRKNILIFILSLFGFIAINGFNSSILNKQVSSKQAEKNGGISQNTNSKENENILSIIGILHPSINEHNNNQTFRNSNSVKKVFILFTNRHSPLYLKNIFASYCSKRINKINFYPFHIAYHRLII
ncbi:MAG: hypothetical protein Q8880_03820, partial [Bacteroidota bacterium]|nr:hypothetical protein [Bacteroidota bacterium]